MALDVLRRITLFADLNEAELHHVRGLIKEVHHAAGTTIFQEGSESDAFYVVEAGILDVLRGTSRKLLGRLKAGDFFGEMGVIDGRPRSATIVAATQVQLG